MLAGVHVLTGPANKYPPRHPLAGAGDRVGPHRGGLVKLGQLLMPAVMVGPTAAVAACSSSGSRGHGTGNQAASNGEVKRYGSEFHQPASNIAVGTYDLVMFGTKAIDPRSPPTQTWFARQWTASSIPACAQPTCTPTPAESSSTAPSWSVTARSRTRRRRPTGEQLLLTHRISRLIISLTLQGDSSAKPSRRTD